VRDCTESLKLTPNNPEVLNNRGVAYLSARKYDEANTDFTAALKLRPDYAEAMANRGRAQLAAKEYQAAIEDLTQAISLKGDLAEAYGNRGMAHESLGDSDRPSRTTERPFASARIRRPTSTAPCSSTPWAASTMPSRTQGGGGGIRGREQLPALHGRAAGEVPGEPPQGLQPRCASARGGAGDRRGYGGAVGEAYRPGSAAVVDAAPAFGRAATVRLAPRPASSVAAT